MFINFGSGELGEVEHLSGMQHGIGERGSFGPRQPTQQGCHEPCRSLIIGNVAAGVTTNESFDLRTSELAAITLLTNDVDGANVSCRLFASGGAHWKRNPSGSNSVM